MTTETETPFVTIEVVAKRFIVSVATVRTWVKTGAIPKQTYLKIGNTYRFNLPEVETALTSGHKEPVQLELDLGDRQ
jgi:excisionase family DNA binding protein